jgi:hypothetical protein
LREVIAWEQRAIELTGAIEIDGAYFGGHVKPRNRAKDRIDRRLAEEQTGTRKVVVVMRERGGRTLPFVFRKESEATPIVCGHVARGSTIHADEASAWDPLHAHYDMRRINHSVSYSEKGMNTNQAESYFARLRRSAIGVHHRISGRLLHHYASEMAWREDRRRIGNEAQSAEVTTLALSHPVSREWAGYWQRSFKTA